MYQLNFLPYIYLLLFKTWWEKIREDQSVAWKSPAHPVYKSLSFRSTSSLTAEASLYVDCTFQQIMQLFKNSIGMKIEIFKGLMFWVLLVNSCQNHSEIPTCRIYFILYLQSIEDVSKFILQNFSFQDFKGPFQCFYRYFYNFLVER